MKRTILAGTLVTTFLGTMGAPRAEEPAGAPSQLAVEAMARLAREEMSAGKIPGMAVTIVQGERTIFQQGFGQADLASGTGVDANTVFELASNSKSLTGLALLSAVERHGLSLDDRVDRFLPWLDLRWQGERAAPTLAEFLHQTSGVPASAVEHLPVSEGGAALETTLRGMMPLTLSHAPGTKFEYSSLNYDVLGLVIEKVSGESFEHFTDERVLAPAGLAHTRLRTAASLPPGMATGYKIGFWEPHPYLPPPFEGNGPAAYFTSTADDMGRWLKMQLGTAPAPETGELAALIRQSHTSVASARAGHGRYAAGWFVSDDGSVFHEGANPTFSSFVGFDEASSVGVAVLSNLNSEHTFHLGSRLLATLRGKSAAEPARGDGFMSMDEAASMATLALLAATCLAPAALVFWQRRRDRRRALARRPRRSAVTVIAGALVLSLWLALIYVAPPYFSGGTPWLAIRVWAPWSVLAAACSAGAMGIALFVAWLRPSFVRATKNDTNPANTANANAVRDN